MPTDPTVVFLLNLLGSAVVSVLCSWLIAAVYFKKKSPTERVARQIQKALKQSLIPILYPHFFDQERSIVIYPEQPAPEDQDVPRVEYARVSPRDIFPGTSVEVLLKLIDLGLDLDNPGGVRARDHRGRSAGVVGLGLGFCRFRFVVEETETKAKTQLTIELADKGEHCRGKRNRNVQTFPFIVQWEKSSA